MRAWASSRSSGAKSRGYIGVGVGEELAGGAAIEEADSDGEDAGEEGGEVVGGHFF